MSKNNLIFIGQNKKVLDIGCSEGILSKMMQNSCKVIVIELDVQAAQNANRLLSRSNYW